MSHVLRDPIAAARLAAIGRGFTQPVNAAQQVFRAVLDAMSRPGRVLALSDVALSDLEAPGLGRGLTAVLLSLLDAETSLWLDAHLAGIECTNYLRFHTGVRLQEDAGEAAFAAVAALQATPTLWSALNAGTDEVPQSGATLIIQVPSLECGEDASGGTRLQLRGPGIEDMHTLGVGGLDAPFWQARAALEADFPRGIDLILCCGDRLAAIPRTTRVTVEG